MKYIYLLSLQQNKYYVGMANDMSSITPESCDWIDKYEPISCVDFVNSDEKMIDIIVLDCMKKLGWWNVRGGKWINLKINPPKELYNLICQNCGDRYHLSDVCEYTIIPKVNKYGLIGKAYRYFFS